MNIPYGKDPEDAPLGTHTYRCKGCNGRACDICCFGDMWESDDNVNTHGSSAFPKLPTDIFGNEVINYVLQKQEEEQDDQTR